MSHARQLFSELRHNVAAWPLLPVFSTPRLHFGGNPRDTVVGITPAEVCY